MPAAVTVGDISKRYTSALRRRGVQALDGVTLHVAPGELFGLLGPNGAGKTTLVKILLGVVRPTAGTAHLFGLPPHRASARRRIGYLPEDHRFPGFLTAGQLLDLYGQMAGVPAKQRARRIPGLLERVGMGPWRDVRVRKLSKGMMQRLGLAQALLNDADLLFLDEPTDGVDPLGRRAIRDLLLELRFEGKTVFLNSHLLSEVEQVCTRVAILHEGRLAREGTIAELTAVERIYEIQCTAIPPEARAALGGAIQPVAEPEAPDQTLHRFRLRAGDRRDLNALLDRLRGAGVLLEAVRPVRRTLEEYFIEVVQEQPPPDATQPPS